MKVEIIETGEQFEITVPYIIVKNKKLYNKNTECYEAVKGDIVETDDNSYTVSEGYTNFQLIPCNDYGIVLSARDGRFKKITHNFTVKEITNE